MRTTMRDSERRVSHMEEIIKLSLSHTIFFVKLTILFA